MPTERMEVFQRRWAAQVVPGEHDCTSGRKRGAERNSPFFLRMQRLLPVTTFLEIGAHEGRFSRAVKKSRPEKTVRAFEANPQVFAHFLLEREFSRLGIDYRHGAIGNRNGSTRLPVHGPSIGRDEPRDNGVWVPLARLDSLCAADPEDSLYALRINAGGAPGHVLEGAEGILARTLAVYIELESQPKLENPPFDQNVMHFLLERDFVPLLRDFPFNHRRNAVFIKKDILPLVEREEHHSFPCAPHAGLEDSFEVEVVPRQLAPTSRAPLPRLHFGSVAELKEAMGEIPLLRAPRTGIDPRRTVVACAGSDVNEALNFYRHACPIPPEFYVLGDVRECWHPLHDFSELKQGMDIQLYFRQSSRPGEGPYPELVYNLQKLGIHHYYFEQRSAKNFWNKKPKILSAKSWDTILNFVNALADATSQYTYMAVCRSRLEASPGYMPLAGYRQYSHPLVHAEPGDIVCEGGCHADHVNISSTLRLYHSMNRQGTIFGFEPVPSTFENLVKMYQGFPAIKMIPMALWSQPGALELVGEGSSARTHAVDQEEGDCPCTSIDAFFEGQTAPTLIKMDVEGAEPHVLKGANQTLRNHLPKLMISIYHGRSVPDWLTIPEMLLEMNLPYSYYCAHHDPWYGETVLYAKKSGVVDAL